jgi:hypothetical protein
VVNTDYTSYIIAFLFFVSRMLGQINRPKTLKKTVQRSQNNWNETGGKDQNRNRFDGQKPANTRQAQIYSMKTTGMKPV